ncbi:polyprenyl synthetase family protein [Nocardia sp. NPDC051570]|uniref:polyprenyl synthetase family protein n=1 Tax=Nocardia sp. NPDC051570 TaxID=3364324 RepID=UPI003793CF27
MTTDAELPTAAAQHAHHLLARAHARVEPGLRRSVDDLSGPLRLMAGYHFGWWDRHGDTVNGWRGKALRPALTFGGAAYGSDPAQATDAAVVVELLHNFSLIHDDVMDADPLRRGRGTVWHIWGTTDAVLLGDALHTLAFRTLTTTTAASAATIRPAIDRLTTTSLELCRGQQADCALAHRPPHTTDYIAMAMGKTGALMGCACALGALCAGAPTETVDALDAFGRQLGLAFQFVDDIIGIWGDPTVTGKPVGADLMRRKPTLPVLTAIETGGPAATELRRLYESTSAITASDITRATELLDACGAKQQTLQHAQQLITDAFAALPTQQWATDLETLAHLAVHRNR